MNYVYNLCNCCDRKFGKGCILLLDKHEMHHYIKGCKKKIRYTSEKKCKNSLKAITKKKRKKGYIITNTARSYKCKFCGGWHIGHKQENDDTK